MFIVILRYTCVYTSRYTTYFKVQVCIYIKVHHIFLWLA